MIVLLFVATFLTVGHSLQQSPRWQPTGNCWTPECGFCRDVGCAVAYPDIASHKQVSVSSYLSKTEYNNIPLYDTEGAYLGSLRWSLRGFFLTGCMACRARRIPHSKNAQTPWTFTISGRKVLIEVRGKIVVDFTMSKKCGERYGKVGYFGFQEMECARYSADIGQEKGSKFAELQDNHVCNKTACDSGRFLSTSGECLPCEPNTFSLSGDNVCTECPKDTYSSIGSSKCLDQKEKPSTEPPFFTDGAQLDELCQAGEYYNNGCKTCPENTYSQLKGALVVECTPCPEAKVAPMGSTSPDDCTWAPCDAGSYLTENGCTICPENTYSSQGDNVCSKCPNGFISIPGSTSQESCSCPDGSIEVDGRCNACPRNTYSNGDICSACPDGTASEEGSASVDSCIYVGCEAGSYRTEKGCEVCPANTYSGEDADECTRCPLGSVSAPGTPSKELCEFIGWEPTGNCWTPECGFCSKTECGVSFPTEKRVIVESKLTRSSYNDIILYDSQGKKLGSLRWNLRGYFLTGCIACRAFRIKHNKGNPTKWAVTFSNGNVVIQVKDKVVLDFSLSKKCAEHYRDVASFGFNKMPCSKFQVVEEMEKGSEFQRLQDQNTCST